MPSLWKKEKGNLISRLVADLQTTPKPGESLVVETGFPTSLVDLFVKNRDKLKKHKTKKHKSKKALTISEGNGGVVDGDDNNDPLLTSVSNSFDSLSNLEPPTRSIGENCEKNATQIDNCDVFVEKHVAHENHDAELHHDSCKNEGNKAKTEVGGTSNQRNMILLPILVGALVLILVLYTKRWFLAFMTLGIQLLLWLQYVGNHVLKLFKPCENVISMPVLKGGLAVVVALYTKWFVMGITIGASLFLLFEYAGNLGFRWFKPCQDIQWRLQGFFPQWGAFKRRMFDERSGRSIGRGVLTRSGLIGSKREARKVGRDDAFSMVDFDQEELGDGAMSRKEVEPQLRNDVILKMGMGMGTNLSFGNGDEVASKGVIEQQCGSITYVNDTSLLIEEDSRNKSMYELLALESKNPKSLRRRLNIIGLVGYVDLQGDKGSIEGRQKQSEDTKIVNHNGKNKKGKKFWKKLVPKKKKNKNEQGKGCDGTSIDDIHDAEVELDEEDEVYEGGQDISDGEGSSILSSYEEDEEGVDNLGVEISEIDNRASACGMIKEKHGNPNYLVILMIPLTGLIGGRLFAVVLTLICCLVFKLVRA